MPEAKQTGGGGLCHSVVLSSQVVTRIRISNLGLGKLQIYFAWVSISDAICGIL